MYNVIIVDDEVCSANELAELTDYNKYGFEILKCFDNAKSALDYIETHSVDVVISDIKMSDISGIDMLKIINSKYPHIKVVLISAYRDFNYAKYAVTYSAFEYLTKPISFDEYIDTLKRLYLELESKKAFHLQKEQDSSLIEEAFYDYFNKIISESVFKEKLKRYKCSFDIYNSECRLAELKINNIDSYLNNVWTYGFDRLLTAVKNVIPLQMYNCKCFTVSSNNKISIITISCGGDFEKNLSDLYTYIENELRSTLYLDTNIVEICKCKSLEALKGKNPHSAKYLANTIMSYIINNDFDRINELKEHFFLNSSLDEQRELCMQLSELIKHNNRSDNTLTNIGIKTISNASTLITYFDDIINSYQNRETNKNFSKSIILEVMHYVNNNYREDITLSSISNHVMLNPSYFSHFFKTQTGECFSDYLIKVRMEHAKQLLKNDPYIKIHSVCESVGYKSQPYFYKTFRAYTGYSPAEYRNLKE